MNRYLTKIAYFLEKQAWDSDYDEDGEYGKMANRSNGGTFTHDVILKAAKDKNVHVQVSDPYGGVYSATHNPEGFKKVMGEIRGLLGPKKSLKEYNKTQTMDWHRDYVWQIGMKKDHPIVKSYIGKKSRFGDKIERPNHAILEYLSRYHP